MKETNCDVVKDLLPLYLDNVCTESSKVLIEKHIAECENCKNILADFKKELPLPKEIEKNIEDKRLFKKFRRKMLTKYVVMAVLAATLTVWIGLTIKDLSIYTISTGEKKEYIIHDYNKKQQGAENYLEFMLDDKKIDDYSVYIVKNKYTSACTLYGYRYRLLNRWDIFTVENWWNSVNSDFQNITNDIYYCEWDNESFKWVNNDRNKRTYRFYYYVYGDNSIGASKAIITYEKYKKDSLEVIDTFDKEISFSEEEYGGYTSFDYEKDSYYNAVRIKLYNKNGNLLQSLRKVENCNIDEKLWIEYK